MTTVVVVDDHPVFRTAIASLLEANGYEVVGQAAGAAEAIELVRRIRPALVLMDVGLPDGSGVAATETILAENPDARVVVLTMFDDDGWVRAALRAGASGYVVKDAGHAEIVAAVRVAEHGALVLGSGVTGSRTSGLSFSEPSVDPFGLTRRERQVLDLLVRGLANHQIATRLGLATKTVSNNVSVILDKLGVADRVEAAALVRELVDPQARVDTRGEHG
jgi:DNA-binding NarL/FixJ family response regulator